MSSSEDSKDLVTHSRSACQDGCLGPKSPPWKDGPICIYFHEELPIITRDADCRFRISLKHCLALDGRRAGGLIYTTTLLPGETQTLYTFDRYRRIRSRQDRMSIHASFKQSTSALLQARNSDQYSQYGNYLTKSRSNTSSDIGITGFFLGFGTSDSSSSSAVTSGGFRLEHASSSFWQVAQAASQSVEAERSVVISTYESTDHREATFRRLENKNECHAVTYYFRRIYDSYLLTTTFDSVEIFNDGAWVELNEARLKRVPKACAALADGLLKAFENQKDKRSLEREILIPTDGTGVETELSRCSSCDDDRHTGLWLEHQASEADVEYRRAQVRLLILEAERRTKLLEADSLDPFVPAVTEVPATIPA